MSSIAGGLLLAVAAGCLNGSWNTGFSPTHGCAVGRIKEASKTSSNKDTKSDENDNTKEDISADDNSNKDQPMRIADEPKEDPTTNNKNKDVSEQPDLGYHHAYALFQFYAAVINIPICLFWAGGSERVNFVLREASAQEITLVCLFSLVWGIGSLGFGLACKVAGVGLGTNLCMGVVMVLGTFLPLCVEGTIGTTAGAVVVVGLVFCCTGLAFSAWSLQVRDADERSGQVVIKSSDKNPESKSEEQQSDRRVLVRRRTMYNVTVSLSFRSFRKSNEKTDSSSKVMESIKDEPEDEPGESGEKSEENQPLPIIDADEEHCDTEKLEDTAVAAAEDDNKTNNQQENSTLYKVAVCLIAGACAAQLQFAFVFGQDLIETAEDNERGPGSTPSSGGSAVIWLLAISLGAPISIIYGLYNNPKDIPFSTIWRCPWYRHVLLILTTCLPWVAHIHLYGFSTTLLPSDLAAAVSWPTIMSITTVTGMLWSLVLGEWKYASQRAMSKLFQGFGFVVVGVVLIMSSVAFD